MHLVEALKVGLDGGGTGEDAPTVLSEDVHQGVVVELANDRGAYLLSVEPFVQASPKHRVRAG